MTNPPVTPQATRPRTSPQERSAQRRRSSRPASPHGEQPFRRRPRTRSHSPHRSGGDSQSASVSPRPSPARSSQEVDRSQGPPGPARLRWVDPGARKSCKICWKPFKFPDHRAVQSEACGHIFAWSCLEKWFDVPIKTHNTCPICRKRLFGWWDRDEHGNLLESVHDQEMEVGQEVVEEAVQKVDRPTELQCSFLISLLGEIRGEAATR